jgi:hypothetical protein
MAIQVTVTLSIDSADILSGYGAGAKVYLYSATTEGGIYSLLGVGEDIISGTESYEIWDEDGTSTTWYKSRVGNSGATEFSDYGEAFQVGASEGYTDLVRVKRHLKILNSADDQYLIDCVDSANAWMVNEVGRFYGPSTDTDRTFDVASASHQLMIPGGLRSFTVCEIKLRSSDSSWIDVTADVALRPLSWDRLDGLEGDRLVFTDWPAGAYRYFYPGIGTAKVTGVFGPAVPPTPLTRIATTVAVWMFQSRAAGAGGEVGSLDLGALVVNRVLTSADFRTIQLYRGVGPSAYAFPAF